jgi:hypothetical protein
MAAPDLAGHTVGYLMHAIPCDRCLQLTGGRARAFSCITTAPDFVKEMEWLGKPDDQRGELPRPKCNGCRADQKGCTWSGVEQVKWAGSLLTTVLEGTDVTRPDVEEAAAKVLDSIRGIFGVPIPAAVKAESSKSRTVSKKPAVRDPKGEKPEPKMPELKLPTPSSSRSTLQGNPGVPQASTSAAPQPKAPVAPVPARGRGRGTTQPGR